MGGMLSNYGLAIFAVLMCITPIMRIGMKPIVETINERKVALGAQKLLMGFSVTQVAEVLHVSSIACFSRLFKRHFGMAPKVYQRLNAPRLSVPQTTFIVKR